MVKFKKGFLWLALIVLIALGFGLFSQAHSVAVIVGDNAHSSVSSAFDQCNSDRDRFLAEGMDCEACLLACPSQQYLSGISGDYSFSYPDSSRWYEGTFTGLACDSTDNGGLLEVKSYCNGRIRVCQRQEGSGNILSEASVENGFIRQVEYCVSLVDCDSGVAIGSPDCDAVSWQLLCDSGYTVNGRRVVNREEDLGFCQSSLVEDRDPDLPELSGSFDQVVFSSLRLSGDELVIRGIFFPDVSGRYYVHGTIFEVIGSPLSVVTGFGVQDMCGDDVNSAGVFLDLSAGDTGLFELSIPVPNSEGVYDVVVGVRDGCSGNDVDIFTGSLEVVGDDQLFEEVIAEIIVDNPDLVEEVRDDIEERVDIIKNLDDCTGADLTVNGCQIAECVDGQVFLLTSEEIEARCGDEQVANLVGDVVDDVRKEESNWSLITDPSTTPGKIAIAILGLIVVVLFAIIFFVPKRKSRGRS